MTELRFDMNQLTSTDIDDVEVEYLISVISETCFVIPVRLIINGTDVFQYENLLSEETLTSIELPAFGLIFDWREKIDSLLKTGHEKIHLSEAGQLNLDYDSGFVSLSTNFNKIQVKVNFDHFSSGISSGIKNLVDALSNSFPKVFDRDEIKSKLSH